ncbi:uncharacterized protein LOC131883801 [Tigriopus californicus]|uniref:uncharacterized protein LOC131883801 n=1 Tax=Tigriopus californicus TaxID=6832 RepID=UPI0027DA7863|nr:uncharacterized protein LOC131883801 [Tigriopus californicus]
MSKNKMSMCYPYGMGVSCICDNRGRIYKCFPNLENIPTDHNHDPNGEAMLSRDDRAESGLLGDDMSVIDTLTGNAGRDRGLDERTEIILAATFLVLIILAFISFVIYRCEKNYMRRRLQESFHISPSGGTMSTHLGGHIPSISVSVQTEPMMTTLNGNGHLANLANTAELLVNGHSQARPSYSSATLPHNAHLVSSLAHQNSHDLEDHEPSRNHNGNGAGAIWTSMMHTAQSFRDVRDVIAMSHSRDNTLNREALHHSRDDGILRGSCTAENLRSPSALGGTMGRVNGHVGQHSSGDLVDDDAHTEYAESDVMLGGNGTSSSNGSASANGVNTGHRY